MKRIVILAVVTGMLAPGCSMLGLGGYTQHADVATRGELSAVIVRTGPPIDGTTKSRTWRKCPPLVLGNVMSDTVGQLKTTARVLFDATHLYVAWECVQSDTNSIQSEITSRDGNLWEDDSVEMFITADPRVGVFHFIMNSRGTLLDAVTRPGDSEDTSWDSSAVVGATVDKGRGWTVTMSVPLKELGARVGKDQTWPMNLNRTKPLGPDQEVESSWSSKGRSQYKDSAGWGKITRVQIFRREDGVTRTPAQPAK